MACGSKTLQSKTVWGRYLSVDIKKFVSKKAKCQNNCVIDSFSYMQKNVCGFSLETLLIWQYVPKIPVYDQQILKFF